MNKQLTERFKIKSIPTVVLTKDDREIGRSGGKSSLELEKWMNVHIEPNPEGIEF